MWILVNGKCLNIRYTKSGTMLSTLYVFTHLVLKTVIILILQMKELGPRGVKPYTPNWHHIATKWGNLRPKSLDSLPLLYIFMLCFLSHCAQKYIHQPSFSSSPTHDFSTCLSKCFGIYIHQSLQRCKWPIWKKKKIHRDKIEETIKWWGSSQVLTHWDAVITPSLEKE